MPQMIRRAFMPVSITKVARTGQSAAFHTTRVRAWPYVPDPPHNLALTPPGGIASGYRMASHTGRRMRPENGPFTTDKHDATEMSAFLPGTFPFAPPASGVRLPCSCRSRAGLRRGEELSR